LNGAWSGSDDGNGFIGKIDVVVPACGVEVETFERGESFDVWYFWSVELSDGDDKCIRGKFHQGVFRRRFFEYGDMPFPFFWIKSCILDGMIKQKFEQTRTENYHDQQVEEKEYP